MRGRGKKDEQTGGKEQKREKIMWLRETGKKGKQRRRWRKEEENKDEEKTKMRKTRKNQERNKERGRKVGNMEKT